MCLACSVSSEIDLAYVAILAVSSKSFSSDDTAM